MSYKKQLIAKFINCLLILMICFLFIGCNSSKEETVDESNSLSYTDQASKAGNKENETNENQVISSHYMEQEYLDIYNSNNVEYGELLDEVAIDINELSINYTLVNDGNWMASLTKKIKKLTKLNEDFLRLSEENKVPQIFLKLHHLTQENIANTELYANTFVEGIRKYDQTLLEQSISITEEMTANMEVMLLEEQRIQKYLKETAPKPAQESKVVIEDSIKAAEEMIKEVPTSNPGDYNSKGEYKPVEKMTQEEIKEELEAMLGDALEQ